MFVKTIKICKGLISTVLFLILSLIVFFLLQSRLAGTGPSIMGHSLYAVLSGSMSPAFNTGSLLAVSPVDPAQLQEGDIIAFARSGGEIVSHRIVGIENENGLNFITQGDANDVEDSGTVAANQVIGAVALAIPWLGRILVFSQTKQGLLLMIVIPASVVLALEARSLWLYGAEEDKKRAAEMGKGIGEAELALKILFGN